MSLLPPLITLRILCILEKACFFHLPRFKCHISSFIFTYLYTYHWDVDMLVMLLCWFYYFRFGCCHVDYAPMYKSQMHILDIWMLPYWFCSYVPFDVSDFDDSELDATIFISWFTCSYTGFPFIEVLLLCCYWMLLCWYCYFMLLSIGITKFWFRSATPYQSLCLGYLHVLF